MFEPIVYFVSFLYVVRSAVAIDCKISQDKTWFDPDNVYQCPDGKTCCIEASLPSCCGDKAVNDQVVDQVKLWGCVIGAAVAVALLICCCRRDNSCCNEDATCKYYMKCGCCRANGKSRQDIAYQKFPPQISSESLNSYNKSSLSVSEIGSVKIDSQNLTNKSDKLSR